MDYKHSGVDIEAGYKSVELMKEYVKGTMRPEVLGGLGGFSGAFFGGCRIGGVGQLVVGSLARLQGVVIKKGTARRVCRHITACI